MENTEAKLKTKVVEIDATKLSSVDLLTGDTFINITFYPGHKSIRVHAPSGFDVKGMRNAEIKQEGSDITDYKSKSDAN